jgi:Family of unknown function (DUF5999)
MNITTPSRRRQRVTSRAATCRHDPPCPAATQPGRLTAVIIAAHPEQGWHLLCNGIVVFDDSGYLLALNCSSPEHNGTASTAARAA